MQSSILLLVFIVGTNALTWCEYWEGRGIHRPECAREERKVHWSLLKALGTPAPLHKAEVVHHTPQCFSVVDVARCQRSSFCPRGLLCWERDGACCAPDFAKQNMLMTKSSPSGLSTMNEGRCPATETMGYNCIVKGVSWCFSDGDCHLGGARGQRCCPTGCGYNVCLNLKPRIDLPGRMLHLSAQPAHCPPMDSYSLTCGKRGVSWCSADSHCLSTSTRMSACCPTRCGYNVCLMRDGDRWIIS